MPRFVHLRKPEISGYVNEVKKIKITRNLWLFLKNNYSLQIPSLTQARKEKNYRGEPIFSSTILSFEANTTRLALLPSYAQSEKIKKNKNKPT